MLFSSNVFLFVFLPIGLLGYQLLSRFGSRAVLSWLTLVSLFFYGFWAPAYLLLLGGSILLNYGAALLIVRAAGNPARQSLLLKIGVCANLLLLMYFKYLFPLLNFFHAHRLLSHEFSNVVLPLGISFFTFTQIAFLIDLKEGIAAVEGLLAYSLFVTFFPHLIAGPIIHPREMMPQFAPGRLRTGLKRDDLLLGLTWFILGLAKKVLIADRISPVADAVFAHPSGFGVGGTWIGVLAYSMQLYFDFSGYSDMAVGLARMFSIEFPVNFNSPYKSVSVVDLLDALAYDAEPLPERVPLQPDVAGGARAAHPAGKEVDAQELRDRGRVYRTGHVSDGGHDVAGRASGTEPGSQFIVYGLMFGGYITIYHAYGRRLWPRTARGDRLLPTPVADCRARTSASWFAVVVLSGPRG